jgi:hypothetical protein
MSASAPFGARPASVDHGVDRERDFVFVAWRLFRTPHANLSLIGGERARSRLDRPKSAVRYTD